MKASSSCFWGSRAPIHKNKMHRAQKAADNLGINAFENIGANTQFAYVVLSHLGAKKKAATPMPTLPKSNVLISN